MRLTTMEDQFARADAKRGRDPKELIRYALGIAVGVVVLLLLFGQRGELLAAWDQVTEADPRWVLAALGAEAGSLLAYAWLQYRTLKLSGTSTSIRAMAALTLANHAISNSVPGDPVVSSAYRYRYYRRLGATGPSAGWTIFTMLVAQAIGMSLLLLLGVLVALLAGSGSHNTGVIIAGLVLVVVAAIVLVRRDLVLELASTLPRGVRRVAGRRFAALDTIAVKTETTLARMRQIPLSNRSAGSVVAIGTVIWLMDFACLVFAFGAVGAEIPWAGVLLAYGVAQVAGSLPIVPGGIGIVEGSLALILVSYGAHPVSALAAALVYRIIAFWLETAVGWLAIGVIAQRARRSAKAYGLARDPARDPNSAHPHVQPGHRAGRPGPPLDQVADQVDEPEAVPAERVGWPLPPTR